MLHLEASALEQVLGNKLWYIAVIGDTPPEPELGRMRDTIYRGKVVPLPDEVVPLITEKRLVEIAQRPFIEIHRTQKHYPQIGTQQRENET